MDRKGKKIETEPAANFPLSSENMDKFADKVAQMVSDKLAAKRSGHVKKSGESSRPRTTPVCTSCGRRHMGQCYRRTGQCFRCGARGHRMTECPSFGWRQGPVPMASTVPTVPTDLVGNEQEMEEDAPGMPANVTGKCRDDIFLRWGDCETSFLCCSCWKSDFLLGSAGTMGGSSRPINALEMADFWNVLWSDFWTGSSRPILDRPGTIRYDKNPESIVLGNRPGRSIFGHIILDD